MYYKLTIKQRCLKCDRKSASQCFMSPSTIPPKKGGRKSNKPPPDYLSVKKTADDGKKTHGKAQKTTENYDGHIRRGKEFLAAYSQDTDEFSEGRGESDSASNTDCDAAMDPGFPHAFSSRPIRCTPFALSTFLAHKCFTENVGTSTASQIHAAFLHYYDNM